MDFAWLLAAGLTLFLVGMLLIFIGALREAARSEEEKREGKAEAGGVVLVGPIPIVFGTSERITKLTLIFAIILTILAIALFVITYYI